jgi:hypothetical protein
VPTVGLRCEFKRNLIQLQKQVGSTLEEHAEPVRAPAATAAAKGATTSQCMGTWEEVVACPISTG